MRIMRCNISVRKRSLEMLNIAYVSFPTFFGSTAHVEYCAIIIRWLIEIIFRLQNDGSIL